jgi:hypothetical protein
LVVAKAWPGFIRAEFMVDGPRHVLQVPADDARMLNSLRTLRMRHGLVECERELDNGNTCWYLTFLASKTLRAEYALPLQDSQLAIRCREVPEDEKTEFELLKSLQDAGWDLQRHTSKALPLPYVDGSNKDLFIGKSAMLPSWNYLRALCNASTIFSLGACNSIAHLQREDYYNDLMAGKRPAVVDSILDDDGDDLRPARRRRAPLGPRPRTKAAPIADANSDAADDCNDDDDGDDSDSDHSIVEALHEALDGDPDLMLALNAETLMLETSMLALNAETQNQTSQMSLPKRKQVQVQVQLLQVPVLAAIVTMTMVMLAMARMEAMTTTMEAMATVETTRRPPTRQPGQTTRQPPTRQPGPSHQQ